MNTSKAPWWKTQRGEWYVVAQGILFVLIVWGPQDGYMPEGAARAYHRDHPDAELHLLRGGHWLLETNLDEVIPLIRDFLVRTLP